jgi:hypothetical protein
MTDINGARTVKEKAILEQLAATGLDALHYYNKGVSVTLLLGNRSDFLDQAKGTVVVARGIAICSVSEQFSRREGRFGSLGRALKAYRKQSSSKPVILRPGIPDDVMQRALLMFGGPHIPVFKLCYLPDITGLEDELIKKRLERKPDEQQQQVQQANPGLP